MSVIVHSDGRPPYILHEPKPGNGPAVCAKCVHVRTGRMSDPVYCEAWTCGAAPVQIRRPAGTDPISGEHVPAWTVGTRCTAKNKTGECTDFVQRRNSGGDRGGNVDSGAPRNIETDATAMLVLGGCVVLGILASLVAAFG